MNHVDLFSGIGGFAYAARQVWGAEYNNICFCEIDPFCQKVLRKNFGEDILIYDDIRTLTRERLVADTESRQSGEQAEPEGGEDSCGRSIKIDLLTGGFPCQSFSCAGKRKGTGDDRYLWPEMFRVIRAIHPRWVVAENVRGLISIENGLVFEQVCLDLESEGYKVQAFLLPACAVNAPHRRDRVWIVANRRREHGEGAKVNGKPDRQIPCQEDASLPERPISHDEQGIVGYSTEPRLPQSRPAGIGEFSEEARKRVDDRPQFTDSNASDTDRLNGNNGRYDTGEIPQHKETEIFGVHVADTSDKGLQGDEQSGTLGERPGTSRPASERTWNESWLEVATRLCRVDDGVSTELYKLETSDRVARLKALGNAIVPQVIMPIMEAIKLINRPESD